MRRGRQTGQAALEFTLTCGLAIFLVICAVDQMMLMYSYVLTAHAAKEGVRYAVVHGSGNSKLCAYPCSGTVTTNAEAVQAVVRNAARMTFHDVSNIVVSVNYLEAGSLKPPGLVQVTVIYPYRSFFALPWTQPTIQATAEGRILN
ncbi:MAG: hypothetical protein H0X25_06355 [Acidobacteriales bacterium]|nr:hypothetical protein [Terriglobales bacterium]